LPVGTRGAFLALATALPGSGLGGQHGLGGSAWAWGGRLGIEAGSLAVGTPVFRPPLKAVGLRLDVGAVGSRLHGLGTHLRPWTGAWASSCGDSLGRTTFFLILSTSHSNLLHDWCWTDRTLYFPL
jgi:hypothetical protein